MLTRILRHEWRSLAADQTTWIVGIVFAVSIGYGVWNGARWVSFQRDALEGAAAEESARYERITRQLDELTKPGASVSPFADPRNPSNAGGRMAQRYAMLPPGPLTAVSIGQSDLLPYYFKVSMESRETLIAANEIENPNRLLAGRFDLAFVIVFLYPLLILALTYNMLSAEQEQGTLALALSQPVSLATLVSGKVTLRALLLVGVVVVFSAVALLLLGTRPFATASGVRLVLWVAVVAAYGAFWFALATFVSAFGRNSTANATILASAWLILVVITPSLFNVVATSLYPVPSRVEMIQAARVAQDEANQKGSQALARYYEDHPELATGDPAQAMRDFDVVRVAVSDEVERRARPVVEAYERQIARQQDVIDRLRFLSPAILMQNALNDVAGTGTDRHRDFLAQVGDFHQQWRAHFVKLIFSKAKIAEVHSLPRFAHREEATTTVAARVATGLLGLALSAIVLAVAGLRRMRRFTVVG
jgi:ABC-2 type transport system permease protein